MKKLRLIATISIIAFAFSCKKKTDDPTPKTTLEYLTATGSKSWKVTKGTIKQGTTDVDLLSAQNPCNSDNLLVLFTDKTYEFREGATKCELNAPDLILKANWQLSETATEKSITVDKFIFLDRTINNPKLIITAISDDSFTGTTDLTFNGTNYQGTLTFSKAN